MQTRIQRRCLKVIHVVQQMHCEHAEFNSTMLGVFECVKQNWQREDYCHVLDEYQTKSKEPPERMGFTMKIVFKKLKGDSVSDSCISLMISKQETGTSE